MPHPLLLGALASVVRASDPAALVVPQDAVRPAIASAMSSAAPAPVDSTRRTAPSGGPIAAPAGVPAPEATTFGGTAAPAPSATGTIAPAYAPPPAGLAPTSAAPTARAAAPASDAAAARPFTPRSAPTPTGTVAPPRASVTRAVPTPARLASAAVALPTLVSERARYRSADPYVAGRDDLADSIVVEKTARKLALFRRGALVRQYPIALGGQPAGHKLQRGDKRTPEGLYYIESRNPNSRYHLALRISYPNAYDLWRSRALGVAPGGDIMIHGLPNGQGFVGEAHRQDDWTEGCIAVTDKEIEEIWRSVSVGTPILIKP